MDENLASNGKAAACSSRDFSPGPFAARTASPSGRQRRERALAAVDAQVEAVFAGHSLVLGSNFARQLLEPQPRRQGDAFAEGEGLRQAEEGRREEVGGRVGHRRAQSAWSRSLVSASEQRVACDRMVDELGGRGVSARDRRHICGLPWRCAKWRAGRAKADIVCGGH